MSDVAEMRPRKERKENADRRRRQLLDAARRSILAHGLAKTTLATVAREAGLSQGVAVFYFKSKLGLLTETLRDIYSSYEALWQSALDFPLPAKERLLAVLETDFCEAACGPDILPVWFAFWGELRFSENYAEVAEEFDTRRREAMLGLWSEVLPDASQTEVAQFASWMETLSDGYWQSLHLTPASHSRETSLIAMRTCLEQIVPGLFDGL